MQRLQHRHGHHRRAVGVGDDSLRDRAQDVPLTSGTTRGTSGSIRQADELSMTIAPAAATRGASGTRAVAPHREQRYVDPGEVSGSGVFDRDLAPCEGQEPARRPGGSEKPNFVQSGNVPLVEDRSHDDPTWPVAPTRYSHRSSYGKARAPWRDTRARTEAGAFGRAPIRAPMDVARWMSPDGERRWAQA